MSGSNLAGSFGKDALKRPMKEFISSKLDEYKVSSDTKKMIMFAIDNAVEYVDYCYKQNKKPDDLKILREFLISRGVFIAKIAVDDLKCGIAIFEFANNLRKNMPKAIGPIPAAIVTSLTLLDLLGVGNSCAFVQEAYYHAFLKTSDVKITPVPKQKVRTEVNNHPSGFLYEAVGPMNGSEAKACRDEMMNVALPLLR